MCALCLNDGVVITRGTLAFVFQVFASIARRFAAAREVLVTAAAAGAVPVRKRRWPTGKLVPRHTSPMVRTGLSLPSKLPPKDGDCEKLELQLVNATGSEKLGGEMLRDWPLFWQAESWESKDGTQCLHIRSARRPDLSLAAAPSGELHVAAAAEDATEVFVEVEDAKGSSVPVLGPVTNDLFW
eukprot:Skav225429  [mRNA]  locus=scaffold680:348582:354682:- [translate_table: standard]